MWVVKQQKYRCVSHSVQFLSFLTPQIPNAIFTDIPSKSVPNSIRFQIPSFPYLSVTIRFNEAFFSKLFHAFITKSVIFTSTFSTVSSFVLVSNAQNILNQFKLTRQSQKSNNSFVTLPNFYMIHVNCPIHSIRSKLYISIAADYLNFRTFIHSVEVS